MADSRLRQWASQRLSGLLQMRQEDCGPIFDNILAYEDKDELKDFLGAFAESTAEHKINSFVDELFEWLRSGKPPPLQPTSAPVNVPAAPERVTTQRAAAPEPPQRTSVPAEAPSSYGRGGGRAGGRGGRGRGGQDDGGKGRGRGGKGKAAGDDRLGDFPALLMPMRPRDKADKRLIVVDAASGKHKELTNCLNCGKVVVEEEGWGPCLFCGNPLEVGDNYGVRHGDDRGFADSMAREDEEKYNASFEKATATKNRLLSYDRDAKKRTRVYDDSTDWFSESVNPWLTEKQREDAMRQANEEERKKREESRKIHAKIDFFGRTVIDASEEAEAERQIKEKENFQNWTENVQDKQRLMSMYEESKSVGGSKLSGAPQDLYNKLRASLHAAGRHDAKKKDKKRLENGEDDEDAFQRRDKPRWDASRDAARVENEFTHVAESGFRHGGGGAFSKDPEAANTKALLLPAEESPYIDADDNGTCLSMHQPYASLLVHGFKRAEGRSWKTEHRGRLWIHAAGKPPEDGEIEILEQRYRELYESHGIPMPLFPSESTGYPTGALLGCVDLEECWSNQEYLDVLAGNPSMPQEGNDNEYIFWCLRPRRLLIPVKIQGDHKLWRIPQATMRAVQRGLNPVRWPAPISGQSALSSPPLPERPRTTVHGSTSADAENGVAGASSGSGAAASSASSNGGGKVAPKASSSDMPPAFDLWPQDAPKEQLQVLERERDSTDRDVVILQNGFVHLVGFIPLDLQQRIIDAVREIGVRSAGSFIREQFDGTKVSQHVQRMYLGKHWNLTSQQWQSTRGNLDGGAVPGLPKLLLDVYDEAVKRANREFKTPQNKKRKYAPFVEGKAPDIAVVNFYQQGGTMQAHQDKQESKESIASGPPVLGICIGDSCEFVYSTEAPNNSRKPKVLRFESGDVYLFGGESRLLWHGVQKILPRTGPPTLRLVPGRLNVTLRAT